MLFLLQVIFWPLVQWVCDCMVHMGRERVEKMRCELLVDLCGFLLVLTEFIFFKLIDSDFELHNGESS